MSETKLEPLNFAGADGAVWQHWVQSFRVTQIVTSYAAPRFSREEIEERAIMTAGREFLAELFRTAAVRTEVTLPAHDAVEIRWDFAVVMPTVGRNWFAEQIDATRREARTAALKEAAQLLRDGIKGYDRADGACRGVLVHQLDDYARRIEDKIRLDDLAKRRA